MLVTSPKGELVGIFTGRDAVRVLAEGKPAGSTHLRQVMTEKPDACRRVTPQSMRFG